jgi:hypothetical protein
MLDKPANELDAWDACGMTPLLIAVFRGDTERVRELLELGTDLKQPVVKVGGGRPEPTDVSFPPAVGPASVVRRQ